MAIEQSLDHEARNGDVNRRASDPKALDDAIAARIDFARSEQSEMRKELAEAGVHIDLVHELLRWENKSYSHALPILARHLHLNYTNSTREFIARAMAMKESHPYWDELVRLYLAEPADRPKGPGDVSMGLAVAISSSVHPSRMGDLIELLRMQHLRNRALLLMPLRRRRTRDPHIAEVLEELRHDPDLSKEINSWKGMKKPLN